MYPIDIHTAKVIKGRGRGKTIGVPTLNIDLRAFPNELGHGIYAGWVIVGGKKYMGAMHYGTRPAFKDTETFEVHIIDEALSEEPEIVDLTIVGRIRDIENFDSVDALVARIQEDIQKARGMLESV